MNVEAFVIHLRRSEMRRAQVERIVEACPVKTHVLDAVDGRAMSDAERAQVYTTEKLFEPRYPFEIGSGEIGCFLSHRNAWQEIIDRGLNAGLVLEDDVEIDREVFAGALEFAKEHILTSGVVQFQVRDVESPGAAIYSDGNFRLHKPPITPLRLSCTLFSPDAAKRLLDLSVRFDRPVDGLVQLYWETGLQPAIVVPSGVSDSTASVGGTTIQAKDLGLMRRLRRELFRPIYRWQIHSWSHKTHGQSKPV